MDTELILNFTNYTSHKISSEGIKKILIAQLIERNKKGIFVISVTVCGNRRIRSLNKKYRDIDRPTDVLSFGQIKVENEDMPKMLGDIVISAQKIESQAREFKVSFDDEFDKMLVHGLKHLLGIHHK